MATLLFFLILHVFQFHREEESIQIPARWLIRSSGSSAPHRPRSLRGLIRVRNFYCGHRKTCQTVNLPDDENTFTLQTEHTVYILNYERVSATIVNHAAGELCPKNSFTGRRRKKRKRNEEFSPTVFGLFQKERSHTSLRSHTIPLQGEKKGLLWSKWFQFAKVIKCGPQSRQTGNDHLCPGELLSYREVVLTWY